MDSMKQVEILLERGNIHPFSKYTNRDPWSIKTAEVESAFLGKKGIYCFWWTGPKGKLLSNTNALKHLGFDYEVHRHTIDPGSPIPLYVGMTSKAAIRDGGALKGRMIDRLIRFPKVFQEYKKTRESRFELEKRKTGTCGVFDLFCFPERIRAELSNRLNDSSITIKQAEYILFKYPELTHHFAEEYKDLFYYNFSISFSEIHDEVDLFYSEALAIGTLRPWLNHS